MTPYDLPHHHQKINVPPKKFNFFYNSSLDKCSYFLHSCISTSHQFIKNFIHHQYSFRANYSFYCSVIHFSLFHFFSWQLGSVKETHLHIRTGTGVCMFVGRTGTFERVQKNVEKAAIRA